MMLSQKTRVACITLCLVIGGRGSLRPPAHCQQELGVRAQATAIDLSTPQKTIETFVAAIKHGDMEGAAKCVVNGKPINLPGRPAGVGPNITLSDTHFKTEGVGATYTGTASVASLGAPNTYPIQETLQLKQIQQDWKIVAPGSVARGYLTQFAIMLGRPELLNAAQGKARETACLSNLRQIGTGCLMFLQDYNETFALKAPTYMNSLLPYIRNRQVFQCPLDKPGGVSYSFNSTLTGLKLAGIKQPAATVMVYEGKNGKLLFRHAGKAGVAFVDGHAKMVTALEAKSLRWKP